MNIKVRNNTWVFQELYYYDYRHKSTTVSKQNYSVCLIIIRLFNYVITAEVT